MVAVIRTLPETLIWPPHFIPEGSQVRKYSENIKIWSYRDLLLKSSERKFFLFQEDLFHWDLIWNLMTIPAFLRRQVQQPYRHKSWNRLRFFYSRNSHCWNLIAIQILGSLIHHCHFSAEQKTGQRDLHLSNGGSKGTQEIVLRNEFLRIFLTSPSFRFISRLISS